MSLKQLNIFFVVEKIGPYHHARFNYLSQNKKYNISIFETNSSSKTYLWEDKLDNKYKIFKLDQYKKQTLKFKDISQIINKNLLNKKPDIVFITGWYHHIHHYLLYKSFLMRIPMILLSDSRYNSEKRFFLKELIKALLIKGFSSAIVAGIESRNYLINLKFNKKNIFTPIGVVDNNHFSKTNKNEKINYSNYFLCVARFVKVKNHQILLSAFELYKKNNGKNNLLLIGAGPEEAIIKKTINKSRYKSSIFIESWKSYNDLPIYYQNSKAVILASLNDTWGLVINEAMACGKPCIVSKTSGCYADLIENSKTGWGFDANNAKELSSLLHKVESMNNEEINQFKKNIKNKISEYDLDNFAEAVDKSIKKALKDKSFSMISSLTSYFIFNIKKIKYVLQNKY